MARGKKSEARQINIEERRQQALDFRKAGYSYRDIGARLEVSHEQARRDVEAALAALVADTKDSAEQLRQLELERLDMLTKALEPMAAVGNPGAVNSFLRVMERRAKLLGLDAPVKQDISVDVTKLTDDELRAIIEN